MNGVMFAVTEPETGRIVSLSFLSAADDRLWIYDREGGQFWRNDAQTVDYFVDQDLDYRALSDDEATELAATIAPLHPSTVRLLAHDKAPSVAAAQVFAGNAARRRPADG